MALASPAAQRRARTLRNAPNTPPEPPAPPPTPGPDLAFPIEVTLQPRGGISINGQRLDRLLLSFDVVNNRNFTADSFRATLSLVEDDPDFGMAFWSNAERLDTEILCGFGVDAPPSASMVFGRTDEIQIDTASRTVSLTGRDYTADLIERQISEKYPNKTASEIAKTLAQEAGLEPVVTETRGLAGTYYRAEHAQMADQTTAWNLLTYLAEREGFDVYVQGKKLFFGPPPDPVTASKWTLKYTPARRDAQFPSAPTTTLNLTRSLTVSRDIVVKIVSWNSSKKSSITAISRSKRPARSTNGKGGGSAAGQANTVTHVFRVPNLTQDQADDLALKRATEIAKQLRSFDADLPGDPSIDIRTIVTLAGTGGSFDTDYHLEVIQRNLSQDRAFSMRLSGQNVSPESTAAL